MIFITVYIVLSIALALSAWADAGLSGRVSILTIGILSFFSSASLRGSLYCGWHQIPGAAMATIICVATATFIGEVISAQLFGVELSGSEWAWCGFFSRVYLQSRRSRTLPGIYMKYKGPGRWYQQRYPWASVEGVPQLPSCAISHI